MKKVIRRIPAHTNPSHDLLRRCVGVCCEGHNFLKTDGFKTESNPGCCGFTRITLPPGRALQTPANFNAWTKRERLGVCRNTQPNEPKKLRCVLGFHGYKTKTVLLMFRPGPVNQSGGLIMSEWFWEVPHHLRVSTHLSEWFKIGILPTSADEPLCFQKNVLGHKTGPNLNVDSRETGLNKR